MYCPQEIYDTAESILMRVYDDVDKVDEIDFKEFKSPQKAKAFISERAKILPRRVTGCCARHQRQLTVAIKRARQLALLPYISD